MLRAKIGALGQSEARCSPTIEAISPTPLLMVVAADDQLAIADLALEAFNRAREPQRLDLLHGGHADAYAGAGFKGRARRAVSWFDAHLA